MLKNTPNIKYYKESEVLSLEVKQAKSVDSEINDNIVIDYDKQGNIVRVNIYNFSFNDFKKHSKAFALFSKDTAKHVLVH